MTDAAETDPVYVRLSRIESKIDTNSGRLTVIETRLNVWQQMVIPMVTGFMGVVGGILLATFALRG